MTTHNRTYTICSDCNAHYEHSPDNWINPNEFIYCPNCGKKTLEEIEKEVEYGWNPPN